jgi:hypothetical protein
MMISGIYKISDTSNVSRNKCSDDDLNCILMFESKPTMLLKCLLHVLFVCVPRKWSPRIFTSSRLQSTHTLPYMLSTIHLLCYSQFSSVLFIYHVRMAPQSACHQSNGHPSTAIMVYGPSLDLHSVIEQEQDLTRNQAAATQCAVTHGNPLSFDAAAWRMLGVVWVVSHEPNNCSCGNQETLAFYYPPVVVAEPP